MLNTQPFYHVGGSCGAICVPLSLGIRVVIPEYYEAERVLTLIQRERCVARTGFGAMYLMEMSHPKFHNFDLSSLRTGWCIASPEVMKRAEQEMGISKLVQIYGSTEGGGTAGQICDSWEVRSQSCGRAVTGTEIAIFDPDLEVRLPPQSAGEIRIKGWWQMNEYLGQPDATAATFDADGWLRTGDRGYLDENGNLYLLGRIKNMLKVGGENVSAEEVEAMIMRHPKVKMAAVLGAPDERLQEVVMAVIELHPDQSATHEEMIEFCATRMATFRVPRHVRFVSELPLTGSGKIQRHVLHQQFVAPLVSK
jgi:fatty-acyl-CoA synthase/long-chain acyl-CoA synthetase